MIEIVIFDLDDTLYDEIDYCRSGFGAVAEFIAESQGIECSGGVFEAFWQQFTSGNHTKTFNFALEQLNIPYENEYIKKLVGVYRNHVPKIVLPDESRDVLGKLVGKYTLALLTDGFLPAQKLKVQALGIEEYFSCIVYTEELGREFWKPSTAGFEKIMEELNAEREKIVYVADNEEKDFIAPNKLGFGSIQLIRPARIHTGSPDKPRTAAQHLIDKISELPDILETLGNIDV